MIETREHPGREVRMADFAASWVLVIGAVPGFVRDRAPGAATLGGLLPLRGEGIK